MPNLQELPAHSMTDITTALREQEGKAPHTELSCAFMHCHAKHEHSPSHVADEKTHSRINGLRCRT